MSKPFDKSVRKYDKGGNIIEKFCKYCDNWFLIIDFHKNCESKDGYHNKCKKCQVKVMKKWYEDKKNSKK